MVNHGLMTQTCLVMFQYCSCTSGWCLDMESGRIALQHTPCRGGTLVVGEGKVYTNVTLTVSNE